MTNVQVVVPYRETAERAPLWEWNRARWESTGWDVTTADSGHEPFNRGASVNDAVRKCRARAAKIDVLVIADADTAIGPDVRAIAAQIRASHIDTWYIGYNDRGYHGLTPDATQKLLVADPATPIPDLVQGDWLEQITSYSGCLIVPMEAFELVGGYDPRHVSWGAEDISWMWALDTLYKPHKRLSGFAVHLYHEHIEAERYDHPLFPINKALCDRYAEARGDRDAMTRLIMERAWL